MIKSALKSVLLICSTAVLIVFAAACGNVGDSGGCIPAGPPMDLDLTDTGAWYKTTPDTTLSDYCTVTLIATFTNVASGAAIFSGSTFQLWTIPSGANPPVAINSEPSGTVEVDETFSYDLTVDVSALASSDTGLVIRPDSDTFGTMGPDQAELYSEEITIQ